MSIRTTIKRFCSRRPWHHYPLMVFGAFFEILGLLLAYPYLSDALRSPPKDPLLGPAISGSMVLFGANVLVTVIGRYRLPLVPIVAGGSFLFGLLGVVYAIQETWLDKAAYASRGWYAPVILIEAGFITFVLWALFLSRKRING